MADSHASPSDFPNRDDIYKGIDAKIHFSKDWDFEQDRYVYRYWWTGGELAAISDELMVDIKPDAVIGDELRFGDVRVVITDHSPLGDFWYVRQVSHEEEETEP